MSVYMRKYDMQLTSTYCHGGAAHPFRLAFWGEGNGPVTSDIRANPDPTPMSRQAPQWVELARGPIYDEGVTGLGKGECHG